MHMKSAEAHFLKFWNLLGEDLIGHPAIPRPKRRGAIFARRIFEKLVRQVVLFILFVQHIHHLGYIISERFYKNKAKNRLVWTEL